MKRTPIYPITELRDALDERARATGRRRSDLIREALERTYLEDEVSRRRRRAEALQASVGAWTDRDETGEGYVEALRPGRLDERLARSGT